MADKILQLEGVMTRVSSLADGGLSVLFHTQELGPETKVEVMNRHGRFGYLLFSESLIQPKDVPKKDPDFEGKTPSQRLRAVIFVLHSQLKESGKTDLKFEEFYQGQLENLITKYKEKLDQR